MTHERVQYLLTKYISDSITKEELEELKIHINISDDEKVLSETILQKKSRIHPY